MGPNLIAHRMAIESLGYGVPPIRFRTRIPEGWLEYRWMYLEVEFCQKIARHFDEFFEKILETQKIRQIDGRFRRNLTPNQIH